MLVCDIEERMPADELVYWIAYFDIKHAKMKKEEQIAKQKNQPVLSKRYR